MRIRYTLGAMIYFFIPACDGLEPYPGYHHEQEMSEKRKEHQERQACLDRSYSALAAGLEYLALMKATCDHLEEPHKLEGCRQFPDYASLSDLEDCQHIGAMHRLNTEWLMEVAPSVEDQCRSESFCSEWAEGYALAYPSRTPPISERGSILAR